MKVVNLISNLVQFLTGQGKRLLGGVPGAVERVLLH